MSYSRAFVQALVVFLFICVGPKAFIDEFLIALVILKLTNFKLLLIAPVFALFDGTIFMNVYFDSYFYEIVEENISFETFGNLLELQHDFDKASPSHKETIYVR